MPTQAIRLSSENGMPPKKPLGRFDDLSEKARTPEVSRMYNTDVRIKKGGHEAISNSPRTERREEILANLRTRLNNYIQNPESDLKNTLEGIKNDFQVCVNVFEGKAKELILGERQFLKRKIKYIAKKIEEIEK